MKQFFWERSRIMTSPQINGIAQPPSFWKTVLFFGVLHFLIMLVSTFLIDLPEHGCMFVTPAFFIVLVVVLSIARTRRFWAGAAVFIPYAVLGFFPVYYYDWVVSHALRGPWGAVAWCLIGPLVGLIGDIVFRYLPGSISDKRRLVITGAIVGAGIYLTLLLALSTFYHAASMDTHLRYFASGWYFSLPWLVINGSFAGYTAYYISRER
jgi:hypothetical protein